VKTCNIRRKQRCGLLHKTLLLLALIVAAVLAFLPAIWVYHAMYVGVGTEAAETTTVFHIVLLLVLMSTGIGMGVIADWMIRHRRFIFRDPRQGSWTESILDLWGYELHCMLEQAEMPSSMEAVSDVTAGSTVIDARRRRGRKPTFTLERWLPIALQWENRDTTRDAFTLGELIAEHLGTNSDGSPVVSEQTYYSTWRERAIEELQRREQSRKKPTGVSAQKQD
jgi:hypothetical protein